MLRDDEGTFDQWMKDLGDNFGVRGDTLTAKTKLYLREFEKIPTPIFVRAARLILEGDERFPTIARMKEALIEAGRMIDIKAPSIPCHKCDGTGFVSTVKNCGIWSASQSVKKILWADYVFRCDCANGAYLSQKILVWNESWRAKGHMLRIEWDEWWQKNEAGKNINPLDRGLNTELKQIAKKLDVPLAEVPGGKFIEDMEKIKEESIKEWSDEE